MDLAARINWGTILPEALERSRKLVSRDAVLLAWVGEAAGRLPRALRMAATTRSNQLPIWTAISARLSYILGLLLVMQIISSFILYFIVPKFEAIFKDFGVSLPQVTILVIDASHLLIKYRLYHGFHPADRDRLARLSAALVSVVEQLYDPALRSPFGPAAYGARASFAGAHRRRGQADRAGPVRR